MMLHYTPANKVWGWEVYWSHPVRPFAVCLCVTKSCQGHNFKSIKASNFKLRTQIGQIGQIVEKCSVQEP